MYVYIYIYIYIYAHIHWVDSPEVKGTLSESDPNVVPP